MNGEANAVATCTLCGEPMQEEESMFKYHGSLGNCPKPPLPLPPKDELFTQGQMDAYAIENVETERHRIYAIMYRILPECYHEMLKNCILGNKK